MCNGFGLIVDKNLDVYFVEPDSEGDVSHSEILYRLGWNDSQDTYIRSFVRIEFPDWTPESFQFDEEDTLPGWAEERRVEIKDKCVDLLRSGCEPAWQTYSEVYEAASAEYDKARDPLWDKFQQARNDAWEHWEKGTDCDERDTAIDAALKEYRLAIKSAEKVYYQAHDAARSEMFAKFSAIKGYVPPRSEGPRDEIPL